ncbi:MAG TPA: GAF domain-containing protein [Acidimicrobiia bacterium]|nr:GAF domain-containing protein [Acidimicrobiia bacterium]
MTVPQTPPGVDDAVGPLEVVHRLLKALHRATSPDDFYQEAVDAVVSTLAVDRASLLLFDPDGVMRFKAWRGLSDRYRVAVEGHSPWTPEDTGARPILVPDVAADPECAPFLPAFQQEGIGALAFVPLMGSGVVAGKFMLYYDGPHDFGPSEVAVAEILAADVALLLDLRRSEEAERAARSAADQAHARLLSLQRVTSELTGAVTVADVAAVVLGTALREVGATTGSLCLIDGDDLDIAYALGYPADVMGRWGRFPLAADLPASDAVRSGRAVFLRSPDERDERYPVFAASPVVDDKAYAMIPLLGDAPVGCLVIGFPEPRPLLERDEPFFTELAARCAAALERARLFDDRERALEAEATARRAAERAQARIASLADASAALAESLDYDETLSRLADAVVPRLADACAVYVTTDEGDIALAALRHRSTEAEGHIRTVLERFPPRTTDRMGFGAVMRTASTEIYTDIDEDLLNAWSAFGGREQLDLLRAINFGWLVLIPLVSRGEVLGVLGLMNEQGHALEDDAVRLANTLAARAATAIDNARLFRDRTAIAQQLQASLLPPHLPEIDGVELAARYSAAGTGIDVGGDFYDVFPLDNKRFVAVLGDVCGRGLQAATVAASARYTIRSAAVTLAEPAAILGLLNEVLLRRQEPDVYEPQFCTALVAVVEPGPDGLDVNLAVAGHPLPWHVAPGGAVAPVGTAGSLLGVSAEAGTTAARLLLAPGEALVCVTDGVLERRDGSSFFGESGLTATLAAVRTADAERLAAAVEAATLQFSPKETTDDFAVLVLRAPRR